MRMIVVVFIMVFLCTCCSKKNDIVLDVLSAEGTIYVYDADQNRHEIKVHLSKEDSLALWQLMKDGEVVNDQNDQGLGWFTFNLSNSTSVQAEIAQSGILRYDKRIVKINLSEFEQIINKYLKNYPIDGKEPNILDFPH